MRYFRAATTVAVTLSMLAAPGAPVSAGPAARSIVFESFRDGNRDVFLMRPDGSGVMRLTDEAADDYAPSWSPDGRRIAFWSNRSGTPQVYVMAADGTEVVQVTHNPYVEHSHHPIPPAWSPDGQRLAFGSNMGNGGDRMHLWTIRPDGTDAMQITTSPGIDAAPAWSPTGRTIYFTRQDLSQSDPVFQLWKINLRFRVETQLTAVDDYNWLPKVSPDGRRLLFVRGDTNQTRRDLFVMNLRTSRERRIGGPEGYPWAPAWSPSGKQIAYVDDPDGGTGGRCFLDPDSCSVSVGPRPGEIFTMKLDGSKRRQLTSPGAMDNTFPSYRP